MFKFIKEWLKDYDGAMRELNKSGFFICHHSQGSLCHYIENKLNTHINTADDKLRTISKDDTNA